MNAFPRRTGSPAVEPITLADALVHLRETADGGENDAYITGLIVVARMACEDRTERSLISTTWLVKLDEFPEVIELIRCPVIAVQSVQYLDADGVLQTLSDTLYTVDVSSEPARIVPVDVWPATQVGAINAVRVAFTAGYGVSGSSVPVPLKHWMLCALTYLYENRAGDIPEDFAAGLLGPFRTLGV